MNLIGNPSQGNTIIGNNTDGIKGEVVDGRTRLTGMIIREIT